MDRTGEQKTSLSRRSLLKLLVTGSAWAAAEAVRKKLGVNLQPEPLTSPEIPLTPTLHVIDFFDLDQAAASYFPPNTSPASLLEHMGLSDTTTEAGLRQAAPHSPLELRALLVTHFQNQYRDHGQKVISAIQTAYQDFHPHQSPPPVSHSSASEAAHFADPTFDAFGNPTIALSLDFDRVDHLVSQTPNSIINLSLQFGAAVTYLYRGEIPLHPELNDILFNSRSITVNGVTTTSYTDQDNKPVSEEEYLRIQTLKNQKIVADLDPADRHFVITDGYSPQTAYTNLESMARLATRHPDKHFVTSGGNPYTGTDLRTSYPDIGPARQRLVQAGLWPSNLTVVDFQGRYLNSYGPGAYGSDLYVSWSDLDRLDISRASSTAAPLVTQLFSELVSLGATTISQIDHQLSHRTTLADYGRLLHLTPAPTSLYP